MTEQSADGLERGSLVHVECPRCGDIGGAINKPSATEIGTMDVDTVRVCYTGDTVILHA